MECPAGSSLRPCLRFQKLRSIYEGQRAESPAWNLEVFACMRRTSLSWTPEVSQVAHPTRQWRTDGQGPGNSNFLSRVQSGLETSLDRLQVTNSEKAINNATLGYAG